MRCRKGSPLFRESKETQASKRLTSDPRLIRAESICQAFYFVDLTQMIQYGWDINAKFRC